MSQSMSRILEQPTRFSIRGLRVREETEDLLWDEKNPEFFGVYELLTMHHEDFNSRDEAQAFIDELNKTYHYQTNDYTQIPESWQSEAQRIQQLERENADLKLQLEHGVKLRADLEIALNDWLNATDTHTLRAAQRVVIQIYKQIKVDEVVYG